MHRVIIPDSKKAVAKRTSLVYFAAPDDDCKLVSLDGMGKTPYNDPITFLQYVEMKVKNVVTVNWKKYASSRIEAMTAIGVMFLIMISS